MDNKYYKPTIEEFFVGFEFEEWEDDWSKVTYNTTYCLGKIKNQISGIPTMDWGNGLMEDREPMCKIRVKYLCEQDILDLGFKYTNNDFDLIKTVKDKINRIRFRTIDNKPHLRIYEKSERSYKDEWLPIFIGKIKNKNELIKLLKQLEIE